MADDEETASNPTEGDLRPCAHPACDCEVLEEEYCSQACGEAATPDARDCRCGHEECSGEVLDAAI